MVFVNKPLRRFAEWTAFFKARGLAMSGIQLDLTMLVESDAVSQFMKKVCSTEGFVVVKC